MGSLFEREVLREVLAGHQGHCNDYRRTHEVGYARKPFTWLSAPGLGEANEKLAAVLQDVKHRRKAVQFEAWELENERWQLVIGGEVRVLYVEVDGKLSKVRAILQWAPAVPPGPHPPLAG